MIRLLLCLNYLLGSSHSPLINILLILYCLAMQENTSRFQFKMKNVFCNSFASEIKMDLLPNYLRVSSCFCSLKIVTRAPLTSVHLCPLLKEQITPSQLNKVDFVLGAEA